MSYPSTFAEEMVLMNYCRLISGIIARIAQYIILHLCQKISISDSYSGSSLNFCHPLNT